MRRLATWALLGLFGCSSTPPGHPIADVSEETSTDTAADAEVDSWRDSLEYKQSCLGYEFWYCDLGATFRRMVTFDKCSKVDCGEELCTSGGHEIVAIGDCVPFIECNPTVKDLGRQDCTTEAGFPGTQSVECDKGKIWLGPCVPCSGEEVCNGLDDDCDGETDEGLVGTCSSACGEGQLLCIEGREQCDAPLPEEEVCNYLDDDCDGLTDEDELNQCGGCGLEPVEKCNNYDDDCDGHTDEDLFEPCSTPCGTGVRICVAGFWSPCSAKQPSEEVCNYLDDDCDDEVDEGLMCACGEDMVGALFPCQEDPLACGQGFKQCLCKDGSLTKPCENGETTVSDCRPECHFYPDPDPTATCENYGVSVPEECNNYDDDCDTLIDENLYTACYSGPSNTEGVGVCQAGEQVCVAGQWGWPPPPEEFIPGICFEEVLPATQDHCNGLDENCDGLVDEGKEMTPTDIVFVVDGSGSMGNNIEAVVTALAQFALNYSDEEVLQWSLVLGPVYPGGIFSEYLELVSDLVPFSEFQSALQALNFAGTSGGNEMLLDALWLAGGGDVSERKWKSVGESQPALEEFSISWRGGDVKKLIILWTDETPQSYLEPQVSAADVTALLSGTSKLKLYTFTSTGTNKADWEPMATATGGGWFTLTSNPTEMFMSLMQILDEAVCE